MIQRRYCKDKLVAGPYPLYCVTRMVRSCKCTGKKKQQKKNRKKTLLIRIDCSRFIYIYICSSTFQALPIFLKALHIPIHRDTIHSGVRQYLHRMIVCLGEGVLPFIPVAVSHLLEDCTVSTNGGMTYILMKKAQVGNEILQCISLGGKLVYGRFSAIFHHSRGSMMFLEMDWVCV